MLKLGNYSFLSMTGNIGTFSDIVEDETRPGVDGHTFRKLGKRGTRFNISTQKTFSALGDAKQGVLDYNSLCGTFQVLEDATGNSYRKTFVHNVRTEIKILGASTDGKEYMVIAHWELQRGG